MVDGSSGCPSACCARAAPAASSAAAAQATSGIGRVLAESMDGPPWRRRPGRGPGLVAPMLAAAARAVHPPRRTGPIPAIAPADPTH